MARLIANHLMRATRYRAVVLTHAFRPSTKPTNHIRQHYHRYDLHGETKGTYDFNDWNDREPNVDHCYQESGRAGDL